MFLLSIVNKSSPTKPVIVFNNDWETITKATSFEAKGEPFIGQLFVAQLILNRQEGCKCSIEDVLKIKFHSSPEYLKNVKNESLDTVLMKKLMILDNIKIHNFWYFYNPKTASDKKFVKAMRKKKKKLELYNHIFVEK